uniref:Uncharacterized protein n=1 Tax=Romanomermis culicivorax TaxID=13658 RepID=A0A915IK22_ROMCU
MCDQPPMTFRDLAQAQGWTEEQLRKSGDLPPIKLPDGVPLLRMPPDLLQDPFRNQPPADAEIEFQKAENLFYEALKYLKPAKKQQQ